eukprot:1146846-Pelagomonas_calceolata.AAC.1
MPHCPLSCEGCTRGFRSMPYGCGASASMYSLALVPLPVCTAVCLHAVLKRAPVCRRALVHALLCAWSLWHMHHCVPALCVTYVFCATVHCAVCLNAVLKHVPVCSALPCVPERCAKARSCVQ